jgi:hypothetical protein
MEIRTARPRVSVALLTVCVVVAVFAAAARSADPGGSLLPVSGSTTFAGGSDAALVRLDP